MPSSLPILNLANDSISPLSIYPENISFKYPYIHTDTPCTTAIPLLLPSNRHSTSISTVTGIAQASIFREITSSMVWAPAYNRCIIRSWQWNVVQRWEHRPLTEPASIRWLIRMKLEEGWGLAKAFHAWTCKNISTLNRIRMRDLFTSTLTAFSNHSQFLQLFPIFQFCNRCTKYFQAQR